MPAPSAVTLANWKLRRRYTVISVTTRNGFPPLTLGGSLSTPPSVDKNTADK